MADDCRAAFVGGNGLRARAGAQIEGMKRIDFGAVFEIAAGPIERMQHPGHRRQRLRKVNRLREHGNHVMRLQDAFDSGERRRVGTQHFAQLAPDRTRADQARHLFDQASASSENQPHDPHRKGSRRGVGAA